ncbi:MAG: hypothetical protein AAF492_31535, partial [Verrucomicrobiota bacterium]
VERGDILLDRAAEDYKKAGDLDPLLLVKKERLTLSGLTTFPEQTSDGLPGAMIRLHARIQVSLLRQQTTLDKRLQKLQSQYLSYLNRLKTEYTQKDMLAKAVELIYKTQSK